LEGVEKTPLFISAMLCLILNTVFEHIRLLYDLYMGFMFCCLHVEPHGWTNLDQ